MFNEFNFTSESLALILGAVTSLVFSYAPGLNAWFASKTDEVKRLIMLGLMVVITGSIYGLACGNIIVVNEFVCGQKSLLQFISILISAVIANQGTYKISPQIRSVAAIKLETTIVQDKQLIKDAKVNASESK
ncbi:MAG: hypothetical protein CVU46_10990 [Chloroflexi bacterium HGW-Chloroflexi-8]|nr:MAG: hypothetical protein CVU46_10990 [Chloroflexi bacterium HGW-Chloroflexi-8]